MSEEVTTTLTARYDDFAKRIEALGEDAAMAVRDKAAANHHEGLQFELNTLFDQDPTS